MMKKLPTLIAIVCSCFCLCTCDIAGLKDKIEQEVAGASTNTTTYTVTYNANGATGGSVPSDPNVYLQGATITVLANSGNLVEPNKGLAGWNTKPDGTGTGYADGNTFQMGPANVTLYALWGTKHVYIQGNVGTSSTSTVPVYWKDGVLNYLPASGGGSTSGIAHDNSGNVYISGAKGGQAGYWKNSNFIPLSLGQYAAGVVQGIAVDTTDNVWVLGSQGSPGSITCFYWKNSSGPYLLPGNIWQCVNVSPDSSGNVYIIGTAIVNGLYDLTAIWKNGSNPIVMAESSGTNGAWVGNQLATDSSGNLYLCAVADSGPEYWKTVSGVWQGPFALQYGTYTGATATDIGVDSSGNLHVVGCWPMSGGPYTTLLYWQSASSAPTLISLPSGASVFWIGTSTFDTSGNFIFVGTAGTQEPGGKWATITDGVPVCWVNGTPINLPMGSGNTWGCTGGVVVGP